MWHSDLPMGEPIAFVPSRKQKYMSKSPTKAELIALTGNLETAMQW